MNPIGFAFRATIQFLPGRADNAGVRTHPIAAAAIVHNATNDIIRQSLAHRNGRELAVFQSVQTAAKGANPERALLVEME